MKKRLLIGFFVITSFLFGGVHASTPDNHFIPKKGIQLLSAIGWSVISNRDVAIHIQDLFGDMYDIYGKYIDEIEQVVQTHPNEPKSVLWKEKIDEFRLFSDRETFARAIPFLLFGIYNSSEYQDDESREELLELQRTIAINSVITVKLLYHKEENIISQSDFLETLEAINKSTSKLISSFAFSSQDPFFVTKMRDLTSHLKSRQFTFGIDYDEIDEEKEDVFSEIEDRFNEECIRYANAYFDNEFIKFFIEE